MNNLLKVILLSLGALLIYISSTYATIVTVNITNVVSQKGTIYLTVCDKKSFNISSSTAGCTAKAKIAVNGSNYYKYSFDIPEGAYAFKGYIDENDNGKLDTDVIGIPKEPVLFIIRLKGPPHFNSVKTEVKGKTQTVTLLAQ